MKTSTFAAIQNLQDLQTKHQMFELALNTIENPMLK